MKKFVFFALVAAAAIAAPAATYYVDAAKGDDSKYDGTSATPSETPSASTGLYVGPKATVQAGVALITAKNSQLLIADGTYEFDGDYVSIPAYSGLIIRGASGDASKVVLTGNGVGSGLKNQASITIRDLTFTQFRNTAHKNGAALWFAHWSTCVASNCVFTANTNAYSSGIGAAVVCTSYPATLMDCTFTENSTYNGGAVAHEGGVSTKMTIDNCRFYRNYATYGGAAYCNKSMTMEITDSWFEGNEAATYGGALKSAGTFKNCTFTNNVANGGGVAHPTAWNSFVKCKFFDNLAKTGDGGVFRNGNNSGNTFYDCEFLRNQAASGYGGAIMSVERNVGAPGNWVDVVSNCTFKSNVCSSSNGGAIWGLTLQIMDCVFEDNRACYTGGGVDLGDCYPTTQHSLPHRIYRCTFRNNQTFGTTVGGGAGALNVNAQRNYLIERCTFERNACTNYSDLAGTGAKGVACGGAVYSAWPVFMNDCLFVSNAAVNAGGAFFGCATGGIRRCRFESNYVDCDRQCGSMGSTYWPGAGSALSFERGTLPLTNAAENCWWNLVEDCLFTNNFCRGNGPTIYATRGALRVRRCDFVDNEGRVDNKGVYYFYAGGTISCNASYFHYAYTASYDDYPYHTGNRTIFQIEDCRFSRNAAIGHGGVINAMNLEVYSEQHPPSYIRNCLFESNKLTKAEFGQTAGTQRTYDGKGAAIALGVSSRISVENCTFVGNSAEDQGGAISNFGTGNAVTNCVFYGNQTATAKVGTNVFSNVGFTDFKVRYSYFAEGDGINAEADDGNIVSDAKPFVRDDHTPYAVNGGHGRRAGALLDWMTADTLDLGGKPRVVEGKVDFGCYQFWKRLGMFIILR